MTIEKYSVLTHAGSTVEIVTGEHKGKRGVILKDKDDHLIVKVGSETVQLDPTQVEVKE